MQPKTDRTLYPQGQGKKFLSETSSSSTQRGHTGSSSYSLIAPLTVSIINSFSFFCLLVIIESKTWVDSNPSNWCYLYWPVVQSSSTILMVFVAIISQNFKLWSGVADDNCQIPRWVWLLFSGIWLSCYRDNMAKFQIATVIALDRSLWKKKVSGKCVWCIKLKANDYYCMVTSVWFPWWQHANLTNYQWGCILSVFVAVRISWSHLYLLCTMVILSLLN